MSSPQVTLKDLIKKWTELTTQSADVRWDEMHAFFADCKDAGIPSINIMRSKDPILRIWVDLTWEEAKKKNELWRERAWWDKRLKGTKKTFDKCYADYTKDEKQAKAPVKKPLLKVVGEPTPPPVARDDRPTWHESRDEQEYYAGFQELSTVEDIRAHKKRVDERERGNRT